MELTGKLKALNATEKVSDKFKKRDFVITTDPDGKYPQHVKFQLTQDKCELLNGVSLGTTLTVHFNIRGREWNGPKGVDYFTTLEAWRIVNEAAEHDHVEKQSQSNDESDLPF